MLKSLNKDLVEDKAFENNGDSPHCKDRLNFILNPFSSELPKSWWCQATPLSVAHKESVGGLGHLLAYTIEALFVRVRLPYLEASTSNLHL